MSASTLWMERVIRFNDWIWTELIYRVRLAALGRFCSLSIKRLRGGRSVFIGNRVTISWGARIEAVQSYGGRAYNPTLTVCDGVVIGQNFHCSCSHSIRIGARTGITANVTIIDAVHTYQDVDIPIKDAPLEARPVSIGEDCLILNNAVILAGASIGNHSVVGANAVVSGVFPDFCVITGNPARVVRRLDIVAHRWVP